MRVLAQDAWWQAWVKGAAPPPEPPADGAAEEDRVEHADDVPGPWFTVGYLDVTAPDSVVAVRRMRPLWCFEPELQLWKHEDQLFVDKRGEQDATGVEEEADVAAHADAAPEDADDIVDRDDAEEPSGRMTRRRQERRSS